MGNLLERIVERKRLEVDRLPPRQEPSGDRLRAARGGLRDFERGLREPAYGAVALIAEVKKASPSAGVICQDFDPVRIAQAYEAAGASCLSVLTDAPFFQGSLDHLAAVREAIDLPLLRKDFILDERQISESIEAGADAILLITAILSDEQLKRLHQQARESGLAVLVEVHDEEELRRALEAGAELIGVNNRDLKTFQVDLATTVRLGRCLQEWDRAPYLGRDGRSSKRLLVAESGIHSAADVQQLAEAGADAVLIGESLMRESNLKSKVRELLSPSPSRRSQVPGPRTG